MDCRNKLLPDTLKLSGMRIAIATAALLLSGCSLFGSGYGVHTADGKLETLGHRVDNWDLDDVDVPSFVESSSKPAESDVTPSGEVVARVYRDAYDLLDDPVTKNSILQRLAAIDLKTAENLDVAGLLPQSEEAYAVAIEAYTKLIDQTTESANRDELFYALAKAYGLTGESDRANEVLTKLVEQYPQSPYRYESQFRVAEYQFARGQYRDAAANFTEVLEGLGGVNATDLDQSQREFYLGTRYMLAWSEFKNSEYRRAIGHFVQLVQDKVDANEHSFGVDDNQFLFDSEPLLGEVVFEQSDKLLDDALRAITLSLGYSPVDQSLMIMQDELEGRDFAHWVYAELAELYFSQERYMDAASVYGAYAEQRQWALFAPWFMNRKVAVLQYAAFDDAAWSEKAVFSDLYHPAQSYYSQQQSTIVTGFIDQKLKVYIDELASYHHAKARSLVKADESTAVRDSHSIKIEQAYNDASYWYQQKISAFPEDPALGETYYLLAESLSESFKLPAAIEAYEMAAYGGYEFARANDAGYAAILGYQKHSEKLLAAQGDPETIAAWRSRNIESALLFFETFPQDERRDPVIVTAANDLFDQGEWQRTIGVSDLFFASEIEAQGPSDVRYSLPLHLVAAQSAFQLEDFAASENSFAKAIAIMRQEHSDSAQAAFVLDMRSQQLAPTIDNYASSIYKQAELAAKLEDSQSALNHFHRLVVLAPNSQLRVAAQRDAITLELASEAWTALRQSIPVFLADFPAHTDRLDLQKHLIAAMEAEQDWPAAVVLTEQIADELAGTASLESGETPHDFRLLAADFANRSGDNALRVRSYESIINNSTRIDESVFEAHYQLALISASSQQKTASITRYGKILALESRLEESTDRTQYISAASSAELAELALTQFQVLKIQEPLRESLRRKRESLDRAVAAYDRTESYAIEQFALQATRRKAQIYSEFAKAIMESDRPAGLDELALEEYEFLLEEQAYPFEEQAIALYEVNVKRAWEGMQSPAIDDSYRALADLMPARYDKKELLP